jgi:hypothetical protein
VSVPKNYLDLLRTVGRPIGGEIVAGETANLADNVWTAINLSNILELKLDAVGEIVLVSTDTGVGNHFKLDPANPPLCLTSLLGPSVTLYAQSNTGESGGVLQYFGLRNVAGGLAT